MSNRKVRVSDIAKHLRLSWTEVDRFVKNGIFPCDRVVVGGKVARLLSKDECEKYFFTYLDLIEGGVSRIAAINGVRQSQLNNNVRNSSEIRGAKPIHRLPVQKDYKGSEIGIGRITVTGQHLGEENYTFHTKEPEETSKKLSFIIAMLLLLVILLVLGAVLFANY